MSERLRLRLLVGLCEDDDFPMIAGGFNDAVWEIAPEEHDAAVAAVKTSFNADGQIDYEWREVWAEFDRDIIASLFDHPPIVGTITEDSA